MTTPLVLLPGLGADERLFAPQRSHFGDRLSVPAWIRPRPSEPLSSYAARFAETLPSVGGSVIGGVSFGGMVALEIAAALPPEQRPSAVIVLSGLRSGRGITAGFRRQVWASRLLPDGLLGWGIRGLAADRFIRTDGLTGEAADVVRAMAQEVDLPFLRWAANACARWTFAGPTGGVPVHQIHGEHDRIIPFCAEPTLAGEPVVLAGGGHLINLSRPGEVNGLISGVLGPMDSGRAVASGTVAASPG